MADDQTGFARAWDELKASGEGLLGKQPAPFTPLGVRGDVQDEAGPLYHGTKAALAIDDLIEPGFASNYGQGALANFVYVTAFMDGAVLAAEMATGDGQPHVYVVEPTGPIDDDPNLTDQKFPGNPTRSYRTREPLRVTGEATGWQPHAPAVLQQMRDNMDKAKQAGIEAIN
ncbi:MAG: NAD(+)--rifampin ADP-ribosyltransferase [Propionibacteriaceae bacterium]|nr:NAD(+)--rifampin ADP-ribosyltransferase [Propionibacteriaceae bacterium]